RRFIIGEVVLASYIVEGTGALCAYLAGKLTGRVHLKAVATGVELDNASVAVQVDSGDVFEGDHAIVAVPTAVLSHIQFRPALPPELRDMNTAVHYGQATKVVAVVTPSKRIPAKAFIGGDLIFAGWRTQRVLYGFAKSNAETLDASTLGEDLCRGFALSPQ